jgi:hypothetical protein
MVVETRRASCDEIAGADRGETVTVPSAPALRVVRRGELDRCRRRMVEGGRADGQFKMVHLTTDERFDADRDVFDPRSIRDAVPA